MEKSLKQSLAAALQGMESEEEIVSQIKRFFVNPSDEDVQLLYKIKADQYAYILANYDKIAESIPEEAKKVKEIYLEDKVDPTSEQYDEAERIYQETYDSLFSHLDQDVKEAKDFFSQLNQSTTISFPNVSNLDN
jgi:hypothetical protein